MNKSFQRHSHVSSIMAMLVGKAYLPEPIVSSVAPFT